MRKIAIVFTVVAQVLFSEVFAQKEIIDFLNAGIEDANALGQAYLRPYGEMLGVNLNGGWYHTAKVHKFLGFDVMFSATYTTVPSSGKSFDADKIGLQNVSPLNGSITPTMSAKKSEERSFSFNEYPGTEILTIKGSEQDYFVSPMLQAAVGLPFHTEVMGRYMPEVSIAEYGKVSLWGLGIKHSIKDYIPFIKRVPMLELSVLGAYTNFSTGMQVSYKENEGKLEIGANSFTVRALAGINVSVLSVYAGIGYGNTSSNFDVKGTFSGIPLEDSPVENPISLAYTTDGFDFNVGLRLKFAIFAIYADYTVGDYSVITAGLGFSVR